MTSRVRGSLRPAAPGVAGARRPGRVVDRVSPADLMQLAADVGPAPMQVGAVLVLGTGPGFSVEQARRLLGERIAAVPRLRQRLYRAPPGCGRPFWADDPAFDSCRHVRQVPCPVPGDERALLDVAAVIGGPLPRSRPLWSAVFVTGLAGGGTGLVVAMSHVLADGIGGLAVLASLVDEGPGLPPAGAAAVPFPAPVPGAGALAADAWAGRACRLAHPAGSGPGLRPRHPKSGRSRRQSFCMGIPLLAGEGSRCEPKATWRRQRRALRCGYRKAQALRAAREEPVRRLGVQPPSDPGAAAGPPGRLLARWGGCGFG